MGDSQPDFIALAGVGPSGGPDSGLLRRYATENWNLELKGDALCLSMDPDQALSYLSPYNEGDLFGLRFNERADHGWFSPQPHPCSSKQNGLLK